MCLPAGSRLRDVVSMQQLVSALRKKRQGGSRGQRRFREDLFHSFPGQLCTVEGAAESALTPARQTCLYRGGHAPSRSYEDVCVQQVGKVPQQQKLDWAEC